MKFVLTWLISPENLKRQPCHTNWVSSLFVHMNVMCCCVYSLLYVYKVQLYAAQSYKVNAHKVLLYVYKNKLLHCAFIWTCGAARPSTCIQFIMYNVQTKTHRVTLRSIEKPAYLFVYIWTAIYYIYLKMKLNATTISLWCVNQRLFFKFKYAVNFNFQGYRIYKQRLMVASGWSCMYDARKYNCGCV